MKREMNCKKCADSWAAMIGKYPGEEIKVVEGIAKGDFVCDGCGGNLFSNEPAYAVSVYTVRTPYFSWEGEYLL